MIFEAPTGDMGVHPSERKFHEISFSCDDVEATRAELESRGVEFTRPIRDDGFGLTTEFKMPDGQEVMLYQAKYTTEFG